MSFTLTGTLEDHSGKPHAGIGLTIQPHPNVNPDSAADVVHSGGWSGKTDTDGRFTVQLATFPGLTYLIRSTPGSVLPARRFEAPADGALLDLADIVPIPAPSPMADYVRGASAYEVAVAEGFVGTESEWLESLRGGGGGEGGVTDHGALDGLGDDDHTQYALADGSRGTFATTAQGAKADTAVQPGGLATVATSGSYTDLSSKPTIPSAPGDVGAQPAATGTPDGTKFLRDDNTWAAVPSGGGFAPAPDHQTVVIDADVTLPIDRTVLTLRVSAPAVLTVPDAPEGSVITVHVAEGWEHISWAAGVIVTGDSLTTETWVVLVRKEGAWSALVSGSGSGGMTGHGRPDGKSWANGEWTPTQGAPLIAPLGTTYTDLDQTDGATQWMVTGLGYVSWHDPDTDTYPSMEDGPIWEVTVGQARWSRGSQSYYPDPLTPPAGYDFISIYATRKGDWVDVQVEFLPSGIGQGVPVTVPAVESYFFRPPDTFAPSHHGGLPIEINGDPEFVAAVGEPPQVSLSSISYLSIPSFEIGAYTAGEYPWAQMFVKAEYRIKEPLSWPVQMERGDMA